MQVVIDVPNWLYSAIQEHKEPVYSQSLGDAVRDGTPLPKGHGKLIDVTKVGTTNFRVLEALMKAPTIIGADRAESEGKV